MTPKQLIGKIHLWLGLATGLIVFIIGITGCLYVFIDEIKPLVYKERLFIQIPENPTRLSLSTLKDNAQNALGKNYPLQGIEMPTNKNATIAFRTRKFKEQAFLHSNYTEYYYRVYVNPYTGNVVHIENTKWEFFNLVVNMHMNFLLGPAIGGQIIAWSVLLFVITLISGLVLWWPKNKKSASKRIWFRWKDSTKWKRKNYDLHNIPGFYVLIIALIIALTGMVWAFKWFDNSVQWVANGGKTIAKPKPVFSDTTLTSTMSSLDKVYNITIQNYPDAVSHFISIPQTSKNTINVFTNNGSAFKAASVKYDQITGNVLEKTTFATKNNGEKIRALNYDIHTGAILSFPGKLLAFLASLISASLPVTGFLIWWGRNNKKEKKSKSPSSLKKSLQQMSV